MLTQRTGQSIDCPVFLFYNLKSGTALLYAFEQHKEGRMRRGMREEFHALWLQIVFAQCTHQICQTLRTVTKGKAAAVFDNTAGTGTKLIQRAGFFTACRAATVPAA